MKGPTAQDRAAGLTTNVPEGTTLRGVSIADGTATVDLSKTFEATHQLQVLAPGGGTCGPWGKVLDLPTGTSGAITARVFEASPQDGSPLHRSTSRSQRGDVGRRDDHARNLHAASRDVGG